MLLCVTGIENEKKLNIYNDFYVLRAFFITGKR